MDKKTTTPNESVVLTSHVATNDTIDLNADQPIHEDDSGKRQKCFETVVEALEELKTIPFIQKTISHDHLEKDSISLICQLFPQWNEEDLVVSRCTDGITNKLLRIKNGLLNITVLVRCYGSGTAHIIDRQNELVSLITLSKLDLAPPIYGRFMNGFCYGYIDGKVLSSDDIRSFAAPAIAKKLAKWHSIQFPVDTTGPSGGRQPALWQTMRRWLKLIPDQYKNTLTQEKYTKNHDILGRDVIERELDYLENELPISSVSKVVFCHNDLLSANIIYHQPTGSQDPPLSHIDSNQSLNSDKQPTVSFIDYEYGGYFYNSFDIANHFNEYAGFECDYSKFPPQEFQKEWIRIYLKEFKSLQCSHSSSQSQINANVENDGEVDEMYLDVQKFALVSHFLWAIWALVQASISDIEFDYMEYAICRFREYYRSKSKLL